jgi:tRNA(Ile)-lysidine synthase
MALTLLAADWVRAQRGAILALTVDHGLRPDSAADALGVVARLAVRGIPCRVLTWEGGKPRTGIQAAARDVRYRLLGEACRQAGILHLLVAHQLEDQAETVAMRRARGSGPAGQAGIPAVREVTGLRILRPLLGVSRQRLVRTLQARGETWLEDPANVAPGFARTRLRQGGALDVPLLAREAATLAAVRAAGDRALARRLAAAVQAHPLGFVRCHLPAVENHLAEILERLLVTVSGRPLPPRRARLDRLVRELGRLPNERRVATMGGCVVASDGTVLTVLREPAAAKGSGAIRPGERWHWDGRFEVAYRAGPRPYDLGPMGAAGRMQLEQELRRRLRQSGVPARAIESLPAFWEGGHLVACPPLEAMGAAAATGVVAAATWVPRIGLAEAPFLGTNIVSSRPSLIYPSRGGSVLDCARPVEPAAPRPETELERG